MKAKITARKINNDACIIKPAKKERQWMDETPDKYAYRCLPLTISNSTGWDLFPPCNFMIAYSSTNPHHKEAITVHYEEEGYSFVESTFGSGVVTMHTGYLFETNENVDLMVMGPPNYPVDFAYPLSGIVETWWLKFTFTMNWKMSKNGFFVWTKDMPFCRIIPVPHKFDIEEATIEDLSDTPELHEEFLQNAESRIQLLDDLFESFKNNRDVGSVVLGQSSTHWEKNYYRGVDIHGKKQKNHVVKRVFPEFKRKNGKDDISKSD